MFVIARVGIVTLALLLTVTPAAVAQDGSLGGKHRWTLTSDPLGNGSTCD
jgi:hypothetical protein